MFDLFSLLLQQVFFQYINPFKSNYAKEVSFLAVFGEVGMKFKNISSTQFNEVLM